MTTATALPTAVPTAQQDRTPAQVLREAADLIDRDGWGQGDYFDAQTGCYCAVGALWKAHSPEWNGNNGERWKPDFVGVLNVLDDYLSRVSGEPDVIQWNDRAGQTGAEVTQAMRDAADRWDSQQAHPAGKKLAS